MVNKTLYSWTNQWEKDIYGTQMEVSINGVPPEWVVDFMENPIQVDDLGVYTISGKPQKDSIIVQH